jgi:hypothetical protein
MYALRLTRRAAFVLLALALAAAWLFSGPAAVAAPTPTKSVTLTASSSCTLTATFTWSDYHGGKMTAGVVIVSEGKEVGNSVVGVNGRSGTVSVNWQTNVSAQQDTFDATGHLFDNKGNTVASTTTETHFYCSVL